MLRVVKPVVFTPAMLVSSTAVDVAAWAAGTYALDAVVTHNHPTTGLPRNWKSLVAANATVPGVDPTKWQNIGPTNKTAMFDDRVSSQTTQAGSDLVVVYQPNAICTVLGLLNLKGSTVTVEVLEGAEVTYTKTTNLALENIYSWLDYFTADFEPLTKTIFDGVPVYYSSTVRITVTGAETAIGHCIVGQAKTLGAVKYGATSSILDYSLKETDEEFGGTVFVERDFADEASFPVRVPKAKLNGVKHLLRSLRATPSLWVGSEEVEYAEMFIVFGWYRSHTIVAEYFDESALDIEIEGLV